MAYTTNIAVKNYLGITGVTDDVLLTTLISYAQAWIDQYTGRTFEASADSTRYFTVGEDTDGLDLYLDADLCAITTLTNNADGTGQVLTTSDYVTTPRNSAPYHTISIKGSTGKSWMYSVDPTGGISILGKWAYSTAAPNDIVLACTRLAAYLFKQKDAQVFDVTAQPDMGVITVPQGMPADVKILLNPYRRRL